MSMPSIFIEKSKGSAFLKSFSLSLDHGFRNPFENPDLLVSKCGVCDVCSPDLLFKCRITLLNNYIGGISGKDLFDFLNVHAANRSLSFL